MADLEHAKARANVAIEKVIKLSLLVASEHFDEQPEDPGWQAEMYEGHLCEAIRAAAAELDVLKAAEKK